jgi:hypothetical protein
MSGDINLSRIMQDKMVQNGELSVERRVPYAAVQITDIQRPSA